MSKDRISTLHDYFLRWATRSVVFLVLMALALIPAVFLPSEYTTVPAVLSVAFVGAAILCCLMMLVRLIQWGVLRQRQYSKMSRNDRAMAQLSELRRRGAPEWWIRSGQAGRAAYVLGVLILMTGFVLIHPYPGDSNFALRAAFFAIAFAVFAIVTLRLRKK